MTRQVIKQIACPSCGANIDQYYSLTQSIVCGSCRSVINLGDVLGTGETIGKLDEPEMGLVVGRELVLQGIHYAILGRVLYEGWDQTEPSEKWTWTEWLLGANNGRMYWLSFSDEEGFHLYKRVRPLQALDSERKHIVVNTETKILVDEHYVARAIGAEGELTWQVSTGETFEMFEASHSGRFYSVQKSAEELEVYEGKSVSRKQLENADPDAVERIVKEKAREKQLAGQSEDLRKRRQSLTAFLAILMAVISFFASVVHSGSGHRALEASIEVGNFDAVSRLELKVPEANRPVKVELSLLSEIDSNESIDVDVTVRDPRGGTAIFDTGFWNEWGYEDGEYWSEKQVTSELTFLAPVAGTYEVEFRRAPSSEHLATQTTGNQRLLVAAIVNHSVSTWTKLYGLLLLVFSAVMIVLRLGVFDETWKAVLGAIALGILVLILVFTGVL